MARIFCPAPATIGEVQFAFDEKGQPVGLQGPGGTVIPIGGDAKLAYDASGNEQGIAGRNGIINPARLGGARNPLIKPSKLQLDYANPGLALGLTSCTASASKNYQRYSNYTRKVDISASPATVAKGTQTITCDPADKLLTIGIYLPFVPVSGYSITVTLNNTNGFSANNVAYSFDSSYLRQGWNDLRMWDGDNVGTSGVGTLAFGALKSISGTGCDMSANIGYVSIDFFGMTGKSVYLCSLRRGAKASPKLVMGFDATGVNLADSVMTTKVAPLFAAYGYKGYFTVTNVYDMLFAGTADDDRKHTLYNTFGWDALVHTWNHGATVPGTTATITTSRTSNLVTATYTAAHGYPVGSRYYASVSGATPADLNGVFEFTATTTTAATYTAAGVDGAGTGTIKVSTLLADVINASGNSTFQAILNHEIADMAQVMRSVGFWRAANIGAWPNNSCPELETTKAACAAGKVDYFRGIKGSTVKISEFGIDNPLHFGSVEWGSGTTATTLQNLKDKLTGCIGRGEHMWIYGHYVLDDTDPANAAYFPVDNAHPPGSNGNPNPPGAGAQGGVGGYWYLSTIKRFFDEAVVPAVSTGQLEVQRPSEWSIGIGGAR